MWTNKSPRQKRRRAVFVLGAVLTVLGSFSVVLGIAAAAEFKRSMVHRLSGPIWGGIMVIATGSTTAYAIRRHKHKHLFYFLLGVSVAGMTVSFSQWILSLSGMVNDQEPSPREHSEHQGIPMDFVAGKALHGVCMVLGFVETLISFSLSILSSVGICDNGETSTSRLERQNRNSIPRNSGVPPAVVRLRLPTGYRLYPPLESYVSPPPYEEDTNIELSPQSASLQAASCQEPPPPYQSREEMSCV